VYMGGQLVIVNKDPTHLDKLASLKINSCCDSLMSKVMHYLGIPIPPFIVRRNIVLWRSGDEECTVAGLEPDGIPASLLRTVRASGRTIAQEPFTAGCPVDQPWTVRLTFFGHHKEPDLELTLPAYVRRIDYDIAFDPSRDSHWTVGEPDAPPQNTVLARNVVPLASPPTPPAVEVQLTPRSRMLNVRALWPRNWSPRTDAPAPARPLRSTRS
jgi:hypothetical protein